VVKGASPVNGGLARLDFNFELRTAFGDGGTLTLDNNAVNALLIDANVDIVAAEGVSNDGIELAVSD
jgi:hypothetical protein